jgi:hypothetical protein
MPTKKQYQKKSARITRKEKRAIVNRLLPDTQSDKLQDEYSKLRTMGCARVKKSSGRTTLGNRIVDAFTLIERLHTKGHQGISFYEFWKRRRRYSEKPYVKNMLAFYQSRDIDEIRKYKYIYNLYFSSIAIFRPLMAMEVYCRVKAKRVLDFTMGWGGRLVGACALGLDAYYGFDINRQLKTPYRELIAFLEKESDHKPAIEVQFKNALNVDYGALDYDTVFTSPPYYSLETYRGMKQYKTHAEWHDAFYKPLLEKTYAGLASGGHYCLNVPETIYKEACVPVLGKYKSRIALKKGERNLNGEYKEYIYIWQKSGAI